MDLSRFWYVSRIFIEIEVILGNILQCYDTHRTSETLNHNKINYGENIDEAKSRKNENKNSYTVLTKI